MTYRYGPKITRPSKYCLLLSDSLFGISKDMQKENKTSYTTYVCAGLLQRQARYIPLTFWL